MDSELSDSDSDDFDEGLLQQDHLNLLRALGSPLRKVIPQWARLAQRRSTQIWPLQVPTELPRVHEVHEAAETCEPQQVSCAWLQLRSSKQA